MPLPEDFWLDPPNPPKKPDPLEVAKAAEKLKAATLADKLMAQLMAPPVKRRRGGKIFP